MYFCLQYYYLCLGHGGVPCNWRAASSNLPKPRHSDLGQVNSKLSVKKATSNPLTHLIPGWPKANELAFGQRTHHHCYSCPPVLSVLHYLKKNIFAISYSLAQRFLLLNEEYNCSTKHTLIKLILIPIGISLGDSFSSIEHGGSSWSTGCISMSSLCPTLFFARRSRLHIIQTENNSDKSATVIQID